ncbi:unnamed protein product [Lathyrus oleraceus]
MTQILVFIYAFIIFFSLCHVVTSKTRFPCDCDEDCPMAILPVYMKCIGEFCHYFVINGESFRIKMVENSHVPICILLRNGDQISSKVEKCSDSYSFLEDEIHAEVGDWKSKNSSKKLVGGVNSDMRLEEGEIMQSMVDEVALGKRRI